MDSLTQKFNAQQFNASADWSLYIAPLLTLLILDDIARRETRRCKRISKLQRQFHESSMTQSRNQYRCQAAQPRPSKLAYPYR